jgi:hypothetical protein
MRKCEIANVCGHFVTIAKEIQTAQKVVFRRLGVQVPPDAPLFSRNSTAKKLLLKRLYVCRQKAHANCRASLQSGLLRHPGVVTILLVEA